MNKNLALLIAVLLSTMISPPAVSAKIGSWDEMVEILNVVDCINNTVPAGYGGAVIDIYTCAKPENLRKETPAQYTTYPYLRFFFEWSRPKSYTVGDEVSARIYNSYVEHYNFKIEGADKMYSLPGTPREAMKLVSDNTCFRQLADHSIIHRRCSK